MIASVLLTYQPPDGILRSNDICPFQIQSCAAKHVYNWTALVRYGLRNPRQASSYHKRAQATTWNHLTQATAGNHEQPLNPSNHRHPHATTQSKQHVYLYVYLYLYLHLYPYLYLYRNLHRNLYRSLYRNRYHRVDTQSRHPE